jgi:hypothetical protein
MQIRTLSLLGLLLALGVGLLVLSRPTPPVLNEAEIETLARDIAAESRPLGPGSALRMSAPPVSLDVAPSVAASPAGLAAADVVLQPADVGPDFVLMSSGERTLYGAGWRAQNLVRAGRQVSYIEPDGVLFVRSLALAAQSPGEADQIFERAGQGLFDGTQEMPVPALGDRTRAAVEWGSDPFGIAGKIVMFRVRTVVGYVIVAGYEAPTEMDDIVPLARIMAGRAGRS